MSALRKALGENKGEGRYIETVPKSGYRFVAEVKEVADQVRGHEVIWRSGSYINKSKGDRNIDSLAVLPFTVDSQEQELEYLSDGVADSIINNLSKFNNFKVMARNTLFQFRGREADAREVGLLLGVSAVLVGRMIHLRDCLVVRVELVDSNDGSIIWGEQYTCELSGLLALQEEVSREISKKLRLMLTVEEREVPGRKATTSAEAYRLYIKGRYFWSKYAFMQVERSIEYFQRAIELDPNYALAHAGLAEACFRLSNTHLPPKQIMPQARAAALQALSLDDRLAEAHAALGAVKLHHDRDWHGAESAFRRALELSPSLALAHQRLGALLLYQGRFNDALEELEKALESDPLSLRLITTLCMNLDLMGRYDEAVGRLQKSLELDSNYYPTHIMLGIIYLHQHKFEEAAAELEEAFRIGQDFAAIGYLGYTYAIWGAESEAERLIQLLTDQIARNNYVSPFQMAVIYAGLRDTEQAFEWLEKAYQDSNDWLVWVKVSPELDGLRSDPRYDDLLKRIGLA